MHAAKLRAALVLLGFTSVIAQVVLMRELMIVFGGNEISFGVVLCSWLLWTALGSALPREGSMARLELLLAAGFPVALAAIRWSRETFQTARGEALGFGPLLATAFVALGLVCPFCGRLYATGAKLVDSAALAYLLETAGSALGGLAASLWLVRALSPFEIAAVLAALNCAAAAMLLSRRVWLPVACAAILAVALPVGARRVEAETLARFWRGFRLLAVRNTPFGNLAVLEAEGSRSLAENGLVVTTAPDAEAAEEAVDLPLAAHPDPRRVVLVGGAANGSLAEILKHPNVTSVDYVELDPAIPELARRLIPGAIPADLRVQIHAIDGRLFLKTGGERFDAILINLPEPRTTQLDRFYTAEFFAEAARRLAPGGILALAFPASENYLSPEAARFLRCIYKTLGSVFPRVTAIPGETVHLLGSAGPIAADAATIAQRLAARHVDTLYISPYLLPFRITPVRTAKLLEQIAPVEATPLNRDFAPVACYYELAQWSARFGGFWHTALEAGGRIPFWAAAAMFVVLFGAVPLAFRASAAAVATVATGFAMMGIETLLLVGFQALYGYVYQHLALLVAAFMAGMAVGSLGALRRRVAPRLWPVQAAVAIAPLAVCGLMRAGDWGAAVLALVCGALGGLQFGAASRLYAGKAGRLYALDLAGSCAGALLAGVWAIPLFGFWRTAAVLGLVAAAGMRFAGSPAPNKHESASC